MEAKGAGEQAVAEGNLDHVLVGDAHGHAEPGHQVGPGVQVVFGVANHGGLAGSAAGGVDSGDILHRLGEKAEGVVVPDVLLGGEGDVFHVGKLLDLIRRDAALIQPLLIKGNVAVAVIHHPFQPFQLKCFQLLAGHGFQILLKEHRSPSFPIAEARDLFLLYSVFRRFARGKQFTALMRLMDKSLSL